MAQPQETSTTSLPTVRHLLSKLLAQLPDPAQPTSNPLETATPNQRHALLTLHVLFPNEFLPALDLLDRNLITRLRPRPASPVSVLQDAAPANLSTGPASPPEKTCVYLVRSAQQQISGRFRAGTTTTTHEVRLEAWSCSCPAFAFAAFPALTTETIVPALRSEPGAVEKFGGWSRGVQVPVCKHLLACVLVEHGGGGFGQFVEEREVGREELAGWAAGWGD